MPSVAAARSGLTFLGLDVLRDTISVAVLSPRRNAPEVDRIANDEPSVRRLVARFADPGRLRACYEAGPTGYELARLLDRLEVRCEVIAPTLIPKAPGDKVKTDRRDCRRLARLHRAGELVAIRVPTVAEEAVRDLCRARADMLADRSRARLRLGGFLLRHGRVWRDGSIWTYAHERWLLAKHFDDPALSTTYAHYRRLCRPATPPERRAEDDQGWVTARPIQHSTEPLYQQMPSAHVREEGREGRAEHGQRWVTGDRVEYPPEPLYEQARRAAGLGHDWDLPVAASQGRRR